MTRTFLSIIRPFLEREFNTSETMQVLTHNKVIYWCWGVSKRYNIDNRGLLLKVNARFHKSYVLITLAWDDTYTVRIISSQGKVLDTYTDVYFEQLVEFIDTRIETKGK